MIRVHPEGDVRVLQMDAGENRFHPDWMAEVGAALDEVENAEGPVALVTTGAGKFYSNGLDLDYMMGEGVEDAGGYVRDVLDLIGRVLTFPALTVAAINGHAFGAGALLALAHDLRVMRTGRGYFCMPEIDMRAPLHPGMTAIIKARLSRQTAHEVIVTGRRWPAEEALARGIVEETAAEDQVVARAVALAAPLAEKAHPVMRTLKRDLYAPVLEAMTATMKLP